MGDPQGPYPTSRRQAYCQGTSFGYDHKHTRAYHTSRVEQAVFWNTLVLASLTSHARVLQRLRTWVRRWAQQRPPSLTLRICAPTSLQPAAVLLRAQRTRPRRKVSCLLTTVQNTTRSSILYVMQLPQCFRILLMHMSAELV